MHRLYCSICDKTLSTSFRSRHNKSLRHVELSNSVVNRYNLYNIKVEDTNNILNEHIDDYKNKFVRFKFICKISSIIIRDYPKHILIEKYKFKPSDTINMQITFITKLDNMTYRHYLQQPRPAIVNNLVKKINQNPNLINLFNNIPYPVFEYILLRHWGFHHEGTYDEDCIFYPYEWLNLDPNHHSIDVTNHA